jgi:hypothetical protein
MKRNLLSLLFVVSSLLSYAAVTVNSIADLKKLEDGTKVVFSGEAMTTMHFRDAGGIFIQDADTNSIFLKHSYLSATNTYFNTPSYNGYKVNQGGTVVKSFTGTFKKATTYSPDRVEFTNSEIDKIETGSYDNSIPYIDVTVKDIVLNPAKYEYLALKITSNVTKKGEGLYATTYSFAMDSLELPINLYSALAGRSIPAAGTFYGMCDKYGSAYQFLVLDRYHVEPTSFFNLVDLYNFVDDKNRETISMSEVEIVDPMLVNFVAKMPEKTNYYIESTSNGQTVAVYFSVSSSNKNIVAQPGDSIKGLKGYYSKIIFEDNLYKGSTFRINENSGLSIEIVNSNNAINWKEEKVYNILLSPSNYESRLLSLPIGVFTKVNFKELGKNVERVAFVQYDSHRRKNDTIRVLMVGDVDMEKYIGLKSAIMGIFDLSEEISCGYPTILLRNESDIVSDQEFASIGDMIAAGKPYSTKVTYKITNPVLVTYKYYKENTNGDNEHMCGLYLQDATGAILYKTSQPIDGVEPGDSISGLKGAFQYESNIPGYQEHYLIGDVNNKFVVLNKNNEFNPTEVTLDEIVANPMKFAASLIKIDNLERTTKFGFSQGSAYETDFIYQNGATMNVVWDNLYEFMSVVGVVEYGVMGYGLTILPIDIKNTTPEFQGTCSRIKDIKFLKPGTEFTYTGKATVTFTDYENGILIQDYTGGILLKNVSLGDSGTSLIKSGMVITNIKGIYQPANGDIISCIEITDANIANISVEDEVDFICRPTDINVINEFFSEYLEGEALMLRDANIRKTETAYEIVFAYTQGGNNIEAKLPMVAKNNVNVYSQTLIGYARRFDGVLTFVAVEDDYDVSVDTDKVFEHEDIFCFNNQVVAPEAVCLCVYDINGRLLMLEKTSTVNISALNKGIYLVRAIYNDESCQVTKIIR